MKTEVEQVLTSPYRNRIILVPYNEPDGNWFAGLPGQRRHARRVRGRVAADLRLHQGAVAAGADRRAELQRYRHALSSFLPYCQQNHCLPNVITWHELLVPSTVAPDVAAFRAARDPVGLATCRSAWTSTRRVTS